MEVVQKGGTLDLAFDLIQLENMAHFKKLSREEELRAWDIVMAPLDAPLTLDTLCLISMAFGNTIARLEWIIKHSALIHDTKREGTDRFFVTTEDNGGFSGATYEEAIDAGRDADR